MSLCEILEIAEISFFLVFSRILGDFADVASGEDIPIKPIKAPYSRGNDSGEYSARPAVSARLRARKPSPGENRRVRRHQVAKGRWPKAADPPASAPAARALVHSPAYARFDACGRPIGFSDIAYENLRR